MECIITCRGDDAARLFRQEVDKLASDEGTPVVNRLEAIRTLTKVHSRDLIVEDAGLASKYLKCLTHCFGLIPYVSRMRRMQVCPNHRYVNFLVGGHHLVLRQSLDDARNGDHLLYYVDGSTDCTHGGIWHNGRIWSKWGRLPVFSHGIWDVPMSYGDCIRVYERISPDLAWAAFRDWVKQEKSPPARAHS